MLKMSFLLGLVIMALVPPVSIASGPVDWQLGFQEAASPVMEQLEDFHTELLYIITAISLFVLFLLIIVCVKFNRKANPVASKTSHNTLLEVIWTTIPVIILVLIAIPSLKTLYYMEKAENPEMTLKVIGHQWYWQYEYPAADKPFAFDSYMIKDEDLKPGQKRLLEVDNRVVLPIDTTIQIIVTSADVMHSWAVPALGIKTDAVPGRINESWVRITKPGIYYGQCSELCGVGHGFMPLVIEAVSKEEYKEWLEKARNKYASNARNQMAAVQ